MQSWDTAHGTTSLHLWAVTTPHIMHSWDTTHGTTSLHICAWFGFQFVLFCCGNMTVRLDILLWTVAQACWKGLDIKSCIKCVCDSRGGIRNQRETGARKVCPGVSCVIDHVQSWNSLAWVGRAYRSGRPYLETLFATTTCVCYNWICFFQRQEDVVALEQVEVEHKPLPPVGPLVRPKPSVGEVMYVMKQSFYGVWSRGRVLEITPKGSEVCSSNHSCVMTSSVY